MANGIPAHHPLLRQDVYKRQQYQQRLSSFDFDMIDYRWEQSLSPGNEQNFYFGAAAADQPLSLIHI